MKRKVILFSVFLLFVVGNSFAQDKNAAKSIINRTAIIKTYYDQKQLVAMKKGELVELCLERISVIIKTVPYVSLATKPGVTMTDLGIPNTPEYRKILEVQDEASALYLQNTISFLRSILPYSDKDDIIKAIVFYENILKSLHEFSEL